MVIYNHREERDAPRERTTTPKGCRSADGKAKAQPCRIGEYRESLNQILGKETIECFENTPFAGVCATSPKKPFRLSKRNREQSKTSAMLGKHNTMLTSERARVMTQWIGQSTPISSKITTDADLATESDSESLGTWQQKPSKKFLKKGLTFF